MADNISIFTTSLGWNLDILRSNTYSKVHYLQVHGEKMESGGRKALGRGSKAVSLPCYLPFGLSRADNIPSTTNGKPKIADVALHHSIDQPYNLLAFGVV